MLLHRLHLDLRSREARRDLSDPYQLHATLCRAFCPPEMPCPAGQILWRLEPETDAGGRPRLLVQSHSEADWERIGVGGWVASVDPPLDLNRRLNLDSLKAGQRFRYRLRGNPCVTRNGKRLGLFRQEDQEAWIKRKGELHGFAVPSLATAAPLEPSGGRVDVRISQEQMLRGRQHDGNGIRVFSVLYDGVLVVVDPARFREALRSGIGHGKTLGLGLMSVASAG